MFCKNCSSKKLKKVFKLGKQPISSVFLEESKKNLKKYSLDLYKCEICELVQFDKLPPLDDMYGLTYGYNTSLSPLMINHMKNKFYKIKKKYPNLIKNQILDIGSNDGSFLNFFYNINRKNLFGIDPSAKRFLKNYKKDIHVTIDFFSKYNLKKSISKKQLEKKFDLITSFAMFYDIEDPNSFCQDIFQLLNKNGVWIVEFSYLPLLFKNLTYDQICHEHVTYYSLTTFEKVIKKNGIKVIDVSFNEINGGSIEVVCAKIESKYKPLKIVHDTLAEEKKISPKIFELFQKRVDNVKKTLDEFLKNIKPKDVIGYGASTKGNIVLNHLNLSSKNLSYICDANPYKFNRYTPGSNIKIISKNKMRKIKPKYLLVLIWSFRKEVIKQEISYIKNGGKLIFHLPILHVIDKSNYQKYLNSDFQSLSYST
jgi:NDP-4-keto-2,6-dideoxyhexose 3-C-methyltransferase